MRRLVVATLIVALALTLAACGGGGNAQQTPTAPEGGAAPVAPAPVVSTASTIKLSDEVTDTFVPFPTQVDGCNLSGPAVPVQEKLDPLHLAEIGRQAQDDRRDGQRGAALIPRRQGLDPLAEIEIQDSELVQENVAKLRGRARGHGALATRPGQLFEYRAHAVRKDGPARDSPLFLHQVGFRVVREEQAHAHTLRRRRRRRVSSLHTGAHESHINRPRPHLPSDCRDDHTARQQQGAPGPDGAATPKCSEHRVRTRRRLGRFAVPAAARNGPCRPRCHRTARPRSVRGTPRAAVCAPPSDS